MVNSKFEKIAKKIKKSEILWDRRYLRAQGVCEFSRCLDILGTRGKGKNLNLYAVNSKFKKNSKKNLKSMNFSGIKEAWVRKALAIFCDQMTCEVL